MARFVPLVAGLFLVALMLRIGLETPPSSLAAALRRPWYLLRALVVALVIIPLVVVLPVAALGVAGPVLASATLLAVTPGAPFVPMAAGVAKGSVARATAIYFTLGVVTVFTAAPSAQYLLLYDSPLEMHPARLIARLVVLQAVPLFAGLAIHRRWPKLSAALERLTHRVVPILLVALLVLLVVPLLGALDRMGWVGVAVAAFGFVAAWAVGWLGGSDAPSRRAVMVACGAPNIGLALAIVAAADAAPVFKQVLAGMWLIRVALNAGMATLVGRRPTGIRPPTHPTAKRPAQPTAPPPA